MDTGASIELLKNMQRVRCNWSNKFIKDWEKQKRRIDELKFKK